MALLDDINRLLRDHTGYTGDGQGGNGALPEGDRSTARWFPDMRTWREILKLIAQTMGDPSALQSILTEVRSKADLSNSGKMFSSRESAVAAGQDALPASLGLIITREGDQLVWRSGGLTADDPLFANAPRWAVLARVPAQAAIDALLAAKADITNSGKTFVSRAAAVAVGQAALPASLGQIETREGEFRVLRSATAGADDPLFEASPRWGVVGRYPSKTAIDANALISLTVAPESTASAIVATADVTPGVGKKYVLTPLHDSTGVTTLSINGGSAMTIRDSANAAVGARNLKAGVPITLLQTGSSGVRILGPSLSDITGSGETLPSGTDLNDVWMPGFYYCLAGSTYPKMPASLIAQDGTAAQAFFLLVRSPGSGVSNAKNRVFQEVIPTINPSAKLSRYYVVTSPPTEGVWRSMTVPTYYLGTLNAADLDALIPDDYDPHSYFLNGFTHGPAGYSKTIAFLTVQRRSSFVEQILTDTVSPGNAYARSIQVRSTGGNLIYDWERVGAAGGGSPVAGKLVVCQGDSITENYDYPNRLAAVSGALVVNGGVGASRLTQMTGSLAGMAGVDMADAIASGDWGPMMAAAEARFAALPTDDNRPLVTRLSQVNWAEVRHIVAFFGRNDWGNSVPLGSPGDDDRTTWRGAVNYYNRTILAARPQIMIHWVSPMFTADLTEGTNSDDNPNPAGVFLADMGKAALEEARRYHMPVLDLYHGSGIGKANHGHFLSDGTHPRIPNGTQRLAELINGSLIAPRA